MAFFLSGLVSEERPEPPEPRKKRALKIPYTLKSLKLKAYRVNLDFTPIKPVTINGIRYILQRADVTYTPRFWQYWRASKTLEREAGDLKVNPPKNLLTSKIDLSREITPQGTLRWYAYRLYDPKSISFGEFKLSYHIKDRSKLLPYQISAVEHICNSIVTNGAACDGSDTGIGKTYHALAAARDLHFTPGIICKVAGIAVWERACIYMGVKPLFIINWEAAKSPKFKYIRKFTNRTKDKYLFKWVVPKDTILIFDEAHCGNHSNSQNYALWTGSAGIPSISLSATFADRIERLWGLFRVLNVMNYDEFKEWIDKTHIKTPNGNDESLSDVADLAGAHDILYPRFGYRVSYRDPQVAAHVPKAIIQTEIIYLGRKNETEQNTAYRKMILRAEHFQKLGKQAEAMTANLRYRQESELRKADALYHMGRNYMEQGLSVCVFVNFRDTLKFLIERFRTKSVIFGSQEKYGIDRQRVIDDFQSNRQRILLAMLQAGGQSISLHDIHGGHPRISLITPSYNPVEIKQVLGRTYRSGARSVPIVKLVYAAHTIEEQVAETVSEKLTNISALNDGDLMERDVFGLFHKVGTNDGN